MLFYLKLFLKVNLAFLKTFHIFLMLLYCFVIKFFKKSKLKNYHNICNKKDMKQKKFFSMNGGGFKTIYHIGVSKSCKTKFNTDKKICCIGTSMGALTSVVMTSDIDINEKFIPLICNMLYDYKYDLTSHFMRCGERIKYIMNKSFPDNVHEIVSGKCFITVLFLTRYGFEKEIISEFTSKEDLIDCVLASSYIPIWSSDAQFKYRNKYCIDSNIQFNFPFLYNKNTISITFDTRGNIHPNKDNLKILHTFIPVSQPDILRIIKCGEDDGEKYLNSEECIWNKVGFR